MSALSDAALWARASAGDPDAFGLLFDRHSYAIYNYCFRRTGDWSLAEDLTSVVFLEAWRRRAEVRLDAESALPWLYGVATNVIRSQWRSLRRHRRALARLPQERAEGDLSEDAIERLDDEREMRRLLRLLGKLPSRERDVIALCQWSGLTYGEAAVALGVPVGTVRSRLSRARHRLQELARPSGHIRGESAVSAQEVIDR